MHIDPTSSPTPLRYVAPPESARSVRPVDPIKPTQSAEARDADAPFSFEAVYAANLPKAKIGEALRRLDVIREQLVAARTSVPIHFTEPGTRLGGATGQAGVIARAYQQAGPSAPDRNAAATETESSRLDETA